MLISPCTYICAFFIVKRTLNFRSASNQNTFKVLSLFVYRKTSNIKTDYKAIYKIFSLQILQFEKYENKYTIGFDLNISPWFEMIFF